MRIRNYRDLLVWQKGVVLARDVYRLTRKFPRFERYGLAGQLQRAAVSVPSNIAEGHSHNTPRSSARSYSNLLDRSLR